MSKLIILIVVVLAVLSLNLKVLCQTKAENSVKQLTLEKFQSRPNLGVDISKIAEFKAFLHKTKYSFEEFLILDLALLVNDGNTYFFKDGFNHVVIKVTDKNGKIIPIDFSFFNSRGKTKFRKYGNTIIRDTTYLLVGCENKTVNSFNESLDKVDKENLKDIFDNNLFRTPPEGCIDIQDSGKYEIFAELSNNSVVLSKESEKVKTAIGKIRTNSIFITVK